MRQNTKIRNALCIIMLGITLVACQSGKEVGTPTAEAKQTRPPVSQPTAQATEAARSTPTATSAPTAAATALPRWETPIQLKSLAADTNARFGDADLKTWTPQPYGGQDYNLPISIDQTANGEVTWSLTDEERARLSADGFFVMHSQEESFEAIEHSVKGKGQAYYVSADSALHAFHLTFDAILKELERETFRPKMMAIIDATQQEVLSSLEASKGTSIGEDTLKSAAYLGVAQKLFDPDARLDPRIEPLVTPQVEQIMAGRGKENSTLFPDFQDDYGAYKPVGHYAGDPDLEKYFRGMSWLGRVHFRIEDPSVMPDPNFRPSRVPIIITLAMRRAQTASGATAADEWAGMHEALTFIVGPSDDAGPAEHAALMDVVYGTNPRPADLADDAKWQEYQQRAQKELPSPRINSTFLNWMVELPKDKGWRLMGQRFTLDGYIFQQLMFDAVKPTPEDKRRDLPTGPDVMAAFGSPVAINAVSEQGMAGYPNYLDQVAALQGQVSAQPQEQWLARFYDNWLYAFIPMVGPKGDAYPTFMRSSNWSYREMAAALGSWVEIKRDTILYTKMPEEAGGGGCGTPSVTPPTWIEANPNVFYRLSYAASNLLSGLKARELTAGASYEPIDGMSRLAETLKLYGNIAAKELAGEALTEEEVDGLRYSCLVCFIIEKTEPPPVVAAVAGGGDNILEAGTGYIDRMYVVVPVDGKLYVAQGGVYSYYEFTQPRSDRLTDQQWRERLASSPPPQPVWSAHYTLNGGLPNNPLRFVIGGLYSLTAAGKPLNVREEPSTNGKVMMQLTWEYLWITDGPVEADGKRWWKIQVDECGPSGRSGWVQENPEWYAWSY